MKRRIFLIVSLGLIACIVSGLWYHAAHAPLQDKEEIREITIRSTNGSVARIRAEIAADNASRMTGLMNRTELEAGAGMLFVFDEEERLNFWMKNTKLPLDILFFDGDGSFISRTTMDPCLADPCTLYPSAAPARFALEVNRGEKQTAAVNQDWMLEAPWKIEQKN